MALFLASVVSVGLDNEDKICKVRVILGACDTKRVKSKWCSTLVLHGGVCRACRVYIGHVGYIGYIGHVPYIYRLGRDDGDLVPCALAYIAYIH